MFNLLSFINLGILEREVSHDAPAPPCSFRGERLKKSFEIFLHHYLSTPVHPHILVPCIVPNSINWLLKTFCLGFPLSAHLFAKMI